MLYDESKFSNGNQQQTVYSVPPPTYQQQHPVVGQPASPPPQYYMPVQHRTEQNRRTVTILVILFGTMFVLGTLAGIAYAIYFGVRCSTRKNKMLRKLLYHRGIDDEISTYVSDYVTGSLCLLFGIVTLIMAAAVTRRKRRTRSWMKAQDGEDKTTRGDSRCAEVCAVDLRANQRKLRGMPNDSSDAVREKVRRLEAVAMVKAIFGLLFTACGAMLILGGMTHGQVQRVHVSLWHNEDSWSGDQGTNEEFAANTVRKLEAYLSLYVTWQFANICGGLVASLFVLSVPFTMAREEAANRQVSRSRSGSGVTSRSRSSTNNSVALLVSSLRTGNTGCRRGWGARRSLKVAMQALALVLAVASVTYHAWNVVSYLGAIQVDRAALDRIRSGDGPARDAADTATGRTRSPPFAATFALESEGNQERLDVLLDDFAAGQTRNATSASNSLLYDFFLDLRNHLAVTNASLNESTAPTNHTNSPYHETTAETLVAISPLENGSDFRSFDFSSMWGMDATSPLLGLAVFIYACFVTYLALRVLRRGAGEEERCRCCCECKEDLILKSCGCWTGAVENESAHEPAENVKPGLISGLKSRKKTQVGRAFSPLLLSSCVRFFAAWVLLASGLIQFGFSSQCGGEHAMAQLGCPFPDHFNHNSIYHVAMGVAMTMLFFTEAFSSW